jgi:cytochrome c oxidase subunit I+III
MYGLMAVSIVASLLVIIVWLWNGSAEIPEKPAKDVGLGVTLPLYASGSDSVGWWAMAITMLAVFAAFVSLVFGHLFYWTLREDFAPLSARAAWQWPVLSLVAIAVSWLSTIAAMRWNAADNAPAFYTAMLVAAAGGAAGAAAIAIAPRLASLDPTSGVYAAMVWLLAIWCAAQIVVGIVMHLYCLARRWAGRMTARHDMDLANVTLYWHFTAATVAITVALIAGFPFAA